MAILVDTNVLIWIRQDSPDLEQSTKRLIENAAGEVYFSYFSLLEIAMKTASGKLKGISPRREDFEAVGLISIAPDQWVLDSYQVYNEANKDPFDNLLITLALQRNLMLCTADKKILTTKAKGLKLLQA